MTQGQSNYLTLTQQPSHEIMSLLALVFLLAFIKRHGQVINAGKLYTCINVYININKTLNVKIVFYSPGLGHINLFPCTLLSYCRITVL